MAAANTPAVQNGEGQLRPFETFIDFINRRIREDADKGTFDLTAAQIDKILSAPNMAQMWEADELDSLGGRDLVDVEQRPNTVIYRESDKYDSGIPLGGGKFAYVLVSATRLSDLADITWNTGAALIITKLRYLEAADVFGTEEADCVIRGKEAANGTVLKLKPTPARAKVIAAQLAD